ncbi:CCA tRNA nucleotidyltransferase [Maritalea porphyrae]|uniref:Poly(A) polymerase n=1 Tax=Maritalea porphyrae TaxID=880732 RepID=A0ABQ5UKF0_9HYPH|nr:CCA tRNA nucleotidyltransferase [Maritalea porphyrae]GLQ15761.1 poly(A) polymerase [Maritalea porphyrae]
MSNEQLELLRQADWLQRASVRKAFEILDGAGGQTKAVGGIVRNTLLGIGTGDVDMASKFTPNEILDRAEKAGVKAIPTGIEHGTVTLVIEGETIEVTSLRQDIKTNGRHAEVVFGGDWEDDAKRRDFTFNAMYVGPDGELLDPLNGLQDCLDREVRFIGDAKARIKEDYLRILRFYRFFAHFGSGRPEADGLRATVAMKSGLDQLSPERVWQEMKKLLSAEDPSRALLWMRTTSVLASILPEGEKWGIDAIHGVVAAEKDLNWSIDPMLRLISILPPMPDKMVALGKRLRLSNAETDQLQKWALVDGLGADMTEQDLKASIYWGDQDAIVSALQLSLASMRAKSGENLEAVEKAAGYLKLLKLAQSWNAPTFPVKGQDLIKLGHDAGPELGEKLKGLEKSWVESGFAKSVEDLLAELA